MTTHQTSVTHRGVAGYHATCTCGWGRWHDDVNHASTDTVEHELRNRHPEEGTRTMDQALVDYTVRNITTGDEEDIRVLELTDDEIEGFPAAVREEIRDLIRQQSYVNADGVITGRIQTSWAVDQEHVLALLLPYITDRALYEQNYAVWEQHVLGDDYE